VFAVPATLLTRRPRRWQGTAWLLALMVGAAVVVPLTPAHAQTEGAMPDRAAVRRGNVWHVAAWPIEVNGPIAGGGREPFTFGRATDRGLACDVNGDGTRTAVAVRRDGDQLRWFLAERNETRSPARSFRYGPAAGTPVCGDWDGDLTETPGVVTTTSRGLRFQLRNRIDTGPAHHSFVFGRAGDQPVVGDWNGDGRTTIGIVRPVGDRLVWHLRDATGGGPADHSLRFGRVGDRPVVWGVTIGVVRDGRWILRDAPTTWETTRTITFRFGRASDQPLVWRDRWPRSTPPPLPAPTVRPAFAVTSAAPAVQPLRATREHTATGLGTAPTTLGLFTCAHVGPVGFHGTDPGAPRHHALPGNLPGARISTIDGRAVTGTIHTVTPSAGTLTFTTTATAPACTVPVLWRDLDGDGHLDLGPTDEPTEPYAAGPRTTHHAPFSGMGPAHGLVVGFDRESEVLTLAASSERSYTLRYGRPQDRYRLAFLSADGEAYCSIGDPLSVTQFESRLSFGDAIEAAYDPARDGASLFCLADRAPAAPGWHESSGIWGPGELSASPGTGTNQRGPGIRVSFPAAPDDGTAPAWYRIYRASAPIGVPSPWDEDCSRRRFETIGLLARRGNDTTLVFDDTTAAPPLAGTSPPEPRHCYRVSTVDRTGAEGPTFARTVTPVPARASTDR
jgi:hypothetical protein